MTPAERKIHDMVEKLASRKEEVARLEGERKQLLSQIKALGAKDLADAKALLRGLEKEAGKLEDGLNEALAGLARDYEW